MSPTHAVELDDAELSMLLDLVERELRDLPSERRHCATTTMREALRDRGERLTELRNRLRRQPVA
jgi:hypothetical protein